jgi:hypothetical protein
MGVYMVSNLVSDGHLPKVGVFGINRWRYMLIVFVNTQALREFLVKTPARIAELDANGDVI